MFQAARSAEFSGQWQTAVGFYQRLLQAKNVDAQMAGIAVDATYRLLINSIGDENAAYLFMRRDGNRLRSLGTAKRFDRWFLDQAAKRRDLIAMCDRLAAMNDQTTDNLALRAAGCAHGTKHTKNLRKRMRRLSAANALAGYKARLRWVATVMPYNQQLDRQGANAPADPKLTDGPLAAAAELLKIDPDRGAFLVAQGWGVSTITDIRVIETFPGDGERKLAQLLAVLPRLSANGTICSLLRSGHAEFPDSKQRAVV